MRQTCAEVGGALPWTDRDWGERHQFFRDLPTGLRRRLPEELQQFTCKVDGSLAQIHFGEPRIHYEAWFHWQSGRLELGLHFEKDERTNARLFDLFDARVVEIKAGLGESIDLERWDRGWCRIYETWPCEKPDREFRTAMTDRLAAIITMLQPMYDRLALALERG